MQVYPAVLLAFLLNLTQPDFADLGGRRDMRTATRLKVDIANPHEPHTTLTTRRFDGTSAIRAGRKNQRRKC